MIVNLLQSFHSRNISHVLSHPIVNISKNRSEKNTELILRFINGGFPRYVVNQLNILVPVGKDIKIVTPVK